MDFGIRGIDPEPRAGYRQARTRRRHLQEFSDACWQRHEAHGAAPGGRLTQWPGPQAFHSNWPLLADLLIVADWKLAGAAASDYPLQDEEDFALLDPVPAPEVDWHSTYAVELAANRALAVDLDQEQQGDGIELVLERAQLSPGERAVMRAWLYNPDLAQVAEDLGERPQTVGILHRNALDRLRWMGQNPGDGRGRGNVRVEGAAVRRARRARSTRPAVAGGARPGVPSRVAPARRGADRLVASR